MTWEEQRMSFGALAAVYDTHRPEWPAETAAWLTGTEAGGPLSARAQDGGLDVLDLGAGTGKLTRTLVAAGHRVTAVDPSEGMLAQLSLTSPQVTAEIGTGEAIPAGDGSQDAVTVAQAWHWMDQPVTAAQAARVLRPGGLLAIAWHRRLVSEGWVAELDDLAESPANRSLPATHSHIPDLTLPEPFGEVEFVTFDYQQRLTPQELVTLTSTWSYVATRPDREKVLAEVEALGRRVADADGTLTLPHVTYCYRAARNQFPATYGDAVYPA